jgi:hypothetical protein
LAISISISTMMSSDWGFFRFASLVATDGRFSSETVLFVSIKSVFIFLDLAGVTVTISLES